jgi:hypothetical protein
MEYINGEWGSASWSIERTIIAGDSFYNNIRCNYDSAFALHLNEETLVQIQNSN